MIALNTQQRQGFTVKIYLEVQIRLVKLLVFVSLSSNYFYTRDLTVKL